MLSLIDRMAPKPFTQLVQEFYRSLRAPSWRCSDPTRIEAGKVIGIAAVRLMLAGALYYGIQKIGTDPKRTSALGAFVSLPATALYWGAEWSMEYGKKAYESFLARDFQQVAVNGGLSIGSYTLMNCHNFSLPFFGRFGAGEQVLRWALQSDTIEGVYVDSSGDHITGY